MNSWSGRCTTYSQPPLFSKVIKKCVEVVWGETPNTTNLKKKCYFHYTIHGELKSEMTTKQQQPSLADPLKRPHTIAFL
jgi:hypothetical protein